jgi:hypothetical protein
MEESTTYQGIIRRGKIQDARETLLLQGETRWGAAPEAVRLRIDGLSDLQELRRLLVRVLSATSWGDLLTAS